MDPEEWYGLDTTRWMYFHGVSHLTVEGGGKVDGRGEEWWKRICKTDNARVNVLFNASKILSAHYNLILYHHIVFLI